MKKILFVCTANRYRSRTAYELFKDTPKYDVSSCGLNKFYVNDTIKYVWPHAKHFDKSLFEWADVVYGMENNHENDIIKRAIAGHWDVDLKKIINLNIDDIYEYNDPVLVSLLKEKVKL